MRVAAQKYAVSGETAVDKAERKTTGGRAYLHLI